MMAIIALKIADGQQIMSKYTIEGVQRKENKNMAITNSLTKAKGTQKMGFTAYLTQDAVNAQIAKVVGGKNSTRFISSIISAVQTNPQLQECTNQSILSAALQGEALKLPPSPQLGYFFMVPFNNRKKGFKEAQFQLSAKGYKQLAMRSGQYLDIDVLYIRDGEYLGRDKFTGKQKFEFIEDDDIRENTPIIGYLAYFEMLNGFKKQLYWTKSKMEKHADKYSQAFSLEAAKKLAEGKIPQSELWKYSSYWYTSFDEMAEKTMIRQLLSKWGMLSIEMAQAYDADMAVINEDGTKDYVDNAPDVIDMEPIEESSKQQTPSEQPQDAKSALFGN